MNCKYCGEAATPEMTTCRECRDHIAWIENASYEELFTAWRTAPSGDKRFQAGVGRYYAKVIAEKRTAVGPAEHTRISKKIGW